MYSKPLVLVVISVLVIGTVGLSYSTGAIAVPPGWNESGNCTPGPLGGEFTTTCCWTETDASDPEQIEIYMCQDCHIVNANLDCGPPYPNPSAAPPTTGEEISPGVTGGLEQTPTPPPFDPSAPLQGGVFEQQEQQEPPTPPTFAPGTSPGVLEQLQQGEGIPPVEPPVTEGTQSRIPTSPPQTGQGAAPSIAEGTVGEPPIPCGVGTVWDPDIMICVPDLPPVELCPDGSIRQPNGECPALPPTIPTEEERAPLEEAEQPQSEEPEEPEQPPAEEDQQQSLEDNGNNN